MCMACIGQQLSMISGNEQSISIKGNTVIIQYYDNQKCYHRKQKTIKGASNLKKSIYRRNCKQMLNLTIPNGHLKQFYLPQLKINEQSSSIIIKSPFIQSPSLTQFLRDTLALSNVSEKRLYHLFIDLLQILIDQGNLPYFPTSDNIFIGGETTILNLSSVVGIVFLETRQAVSKAQFVELFPLLHQDALRSQSLEIDYMRFKQRALLHFILTLICRRQFYPIHPEKIGETVTFQQAKLLLKKQKESIRRYLMIKSVTVAIQKFDKTNNLQLFNVIRKVLVNQQRLSWPQFISELTKHQQDQPINRKLELHLYYLAQYHWKRLPHYTKVKLYKDGWVSSQNSELIEADKDFFLLKMMGTSIMILLDRVSLMKILEKPHNFDKIGYETWHNFIKILPQTKIQMPQLKCTLSQSYHYQVIRDQLHINNKQSHTQQPQNNKESTGLFLCDGSINYRFIMKFGQRKLTNNVSVHSKQVIIRHEKLKSLDQFNRVFR